jgi:hypothetical protein
VSGGGQTGPEEVMLGLRPGWLKPNGYGGQEEGLSQALMEAGPCCCDNAQVCGLTGSGTRACTLGGNGAMVMGGSTRLT